MSAIVGLVLRRLIWAAIVLFAVLTFVFFFTRVAGDPIFAIVGENPTEEAVAEAREKYGFDKPIIVQFADYLGGIANGDFGISFRFSGQPAMDLVLDRLPATMRLAAIALTLGMAVALPVGIYCALRPGSWLDNAARVIAVAGQSIPSFWLGILLIILFSVRLGMLPSGGSGTIQHLILPSVALAVYSVPLTMRLVRSSMLEVLGQEYMRTARAKGLSERVVIVRHAFRNALIPVVTAIALRLGELLTGAVVLEEVFAYPGLGRIAIESMRTNDFFVIQAFVLVVASIFVIINLLVDIFYGVIDPRVRVS